jgi:hypothetical protein
MDQKVFDQTFATLGVEADFIGVLEALSLRECRCNRRLRDKTKKVSELMAKIAEVRKDISRHAAEEERKGRLS